MKAYERLIQYVKIPTQSKEENAGVLTPTSPEQWNLAKQLVKELKELGLSDARVDGKCYVYASLPATGECADAPALGWIAHMDTAPDFCGDGVNPQVIDQYDGKDVALGESGRSLRVSDFPYLKDMVGRTLITTDGKTLLGADDKAGVAEIMTLLERVIRSQMPHGKLCVAFTPDEEVGAGADHFDLNAFGAEFAYTMDGDTEGEIQYENFNACGAEYVIHGVNVHPGSAKGMMKNAALIGCELQNLLPSDEIPACTEGYEGFYHLTDIEGTVEICRVRYIIRDHDTEQFEKRKAVLQNVADKINQKYGEKTVELTIREQYRNMAEKIKPCFHLIENAICAAKKVGLTPLVTPIRGGTDGARLSYMGLPCPNLGTGGHAYHGPYEHITVEGMELAVDMMEELVRQYSQAWEHR